MATRNRATRGEDPKEFVGKVRKWKRAWLPAGADAKSQKLKFSKWVALGDNEVKPQEATKYAAITPFENPIKVQKIALRPPKLKVKLKVGGPADNNNNGDAAQPAPTSIRPPGVP